MFCFGSGVSVPVGGEVVLHEDEVPELEEALAALAARRRSPARRSRAPRRGRSCSSEQGPHGPVSPAGPQKFSERGRRDDPLARDALAQPAAHRDLVLAEAELGVAGEHASPRAGRGRAPCAR